MMKTAAKPIPPKETPATLADVLGVQAALGALLEEETAYMQLMQIAKVGEMQERKLRLVNLLERYTRYLKAHPDTLHNAPAAEKTQLAQAEKAFTSVMRRNYDTLLLARAVNGAVVKCVMHAVGSRQQNPVYNAKGGATAPYRAPVSITLNQMV